MFDSLSSASREQSRADPIIDSVRPTTVDQTEARSRRPRPRAAVARKPVTLEEPTCRHS